MKRLKKLAEISTPSLGDPLSRFEAKELCDELGIGPLAELYALRNGMFAFEHALHVFPLTKTDQGYMLQEFNDPKLWKPRYRNTENITFFAENIFGEPLGLQGESIVWMDVETGRIKKEADSVEEWADKILANYRVETGYPVAHVWQILNRVLLPKERLIPIELFSMGGSYKPENFYALDALKGLEFRAMVYEQIRDLPSGTKIEFVIDKKGEKVAE